MRTIHTVVRLVCLLLSWITRSREVEQMLRESNDQDLVDQRLMWERETGFPIGFITDTARANIADKLTVVDDSAGTMMHVTLERVRGDSATFPGGLFVNVIALVPRGMTRVQAESIIDFTVRLFAQRRPDLLDATIGGTLARLSAMALAQTYNCQSRDAQDGNLFIWTTIRQLLAHRGLSITRL